MGLIILGAVFCGVGVYFLLKYLEAKLAWFNLGTAKAGVAIFFALGGLFGGGLLADHLGSSFPPESYKETKIIPLSAFLGGDGIYAVIEKENIVFLRQGELVRRKIEEIDTIVSFLPKGDIALPQAVKMEGKRGFFGKWFLLDPFEVKYMVPRSGIKEGSVRRINTYEFVPPSS